MLGITLGASFIKRAYAQIWSLSVRTLKSTPKFIFIKTVFDVEKCLASRQGLSRRTHFLLSEYCRFFKI